MEWHYRSQSLGHPSARAQEMEGLGDGRKRKYIEGGEEERKIQQEDPSPEAQGELGCVITCCRQCVCV